MRRNILLIFTVVILNTLFVSAQTAKTVNYYYRGETIEAPLHNNYFLVYFDLEQLTEEQISDNFDIIQVEYVEDSRFCCMLNIPNNNYDSVVNHFRKIQYVTDVEPVIGGDFPVGVSNKFYVQLKSSNDVQLLETFAKQTMAKLLYQVPCCDNWYALETNKNSIGNSVDVANRFWETGKFAAIDPGFIHHFTSQDYCVSDSVFSNQWGMAAVKACDAWDITTGINQIKVAVVDKGVDVNHREFSHVNVSFTYDVKDLVSPAKLYHRLFCENEYDTCYDVYHGTQVGGIIFANHNANRVAGISPNVSLINISHPLNSVGDPTGEKYAIAINQAVNHEARIINNSWGVSNRNEFIRADLIESAIDNALSHDCIVVFSAGNDSSITGPGMLYPSEYRPEILTVGAINSNLLRWEYSTYGTHLDLVAPGVNIISTNAGNNYFRDNGTSLAAPHVSGTAALMLSVNPNLSAQNVRDIIEQTAQKVGGYNYQPFPNRPNGTWHQQMGYGLLDAHKAVLTAAYHQIYGDDEISLCDDASYTVVNQYNQSVPEVSFHWTCSENIRIVSGGSTGSVIVKGVDFGDGWLSCRVIHAGDTVSSTIVIQVVENVETTYKDVTLTSGMSFPTTFTIGGTVDVDAGTTITWTGKTVHFTKLARLIVRPGGKLVVDGGTLTSACAGEMWHAPAQIAQLQAIAERNTGRASVMAKGRAIRTRFIASANSQTATVDVRGVPAGVYMLRVTDNIGKEHYQKIVVKN